MKAGAEIEWHAGSRPQEQVRASRLRTASAETRVSKDSQIAADDYRVWCASRRLARAEPVVKSSDNLITMHMSKSTCSRQYSSLELYKKRLYGRNVCIGDSSMC